MEPFTKAVIRVPAVVSSLRVVAGLQQLLSFPANSVIRSFSAKHIYIFKIKMWTVLLTTIKKARRNNCQDVDHCQYHLGIDHCQDGNRYQDRERPPVSSYRDSKKLTFGNKIKF